jgi:hypothetical protein
MREQSNQSGDEPVPMQPDPSNRPSDGPSPTQHDGAQNNAGEEDKTGPGRPPRDTRFKKGQPSPNPKGRPRKRQSMLPDVRKLLEQAMNKKIPVARGAKKILMTRLQLSLEQLVNHAAKGDRHALRLVLNIAGEIGMDSQAKHNQALEEALAPNHEAILNAALARRSGTNAMPAERVLAPAALLDDDYAEPPAAANAKAETAPPRAPPVAPSTKAQPPSTPASPPLPATRSPPSPPSLPPVDARARSRLAPEPLKPQSAPTPASARLAPTAAKPQPAATLAPAPMTPQPAPTTAPGWAQPATIKYPGLAKPPANPTRPRPPDPEPDPEVSKPFARMGWTEIRAKYPEWWAEYREWCAEQGEYV